MRLCSNGAGLDRRKIRVFRVVANLIASSLRLCLPALAACIGIGAVPAYANSSASADISAPLRAAQVAPPVTGGDREFRQLFTSWRALDGNSQSGKINPSFAAASFGASPLSVSIPSQVPVEGFRLTSEFGMRWHPVLGGRRAHKGVDLAAPIGTPVHATADGIIARADWFSGYGLYVQIEHGGNLETRYGHMSRLNVAAGQMIHKGEIVGYVGMTGRTTGPHLHYEVRVAGEAVNPIPYMQGAVSSVPVTALASAETTTTSLPAVAATDAGDE